MTNLIAVVLAVLSAVCLAYGAMLQHRGVSDDHDSAQSFGLKSALKMFRRPVWVVGLIVTGLGAVLNIVALAVAPVMVVQPIGAVSLVISVLLGAHTRDIHIGSRVWVGVTLCVVGVAAFVACSATVARTHPHYGAETYVLAGLGIGLSLVAVLIVLVASHVGQLLYVVAAGLMYATVATNVHLISFQFLHGGLREITWFNAIALVIAAAVGAWFVQAAYSQGPPELVIAGLTVIDPIFAVILGSVLLGEAAAAPVWTVLVMIVTGLAAGSGVIVLSRYHPDALERRRARLRVLAESGDATGPLNKR